jgi:hypothetical protein
MSRERACYDMAVIEDTRLDSSFVYRKRPELRSNWTKSGHGHGGIGSVWCPTVIASGREIPSLVHLLSTSHHLPWPTMGDGLVRTFLPKEMDWDLGFLSLGEGERGRVFSVSLRLQEQRRTVARTGLIGLRQRVSTVSSQNRPARA